MRAVNLLPADTYAPKQRLPHAHVVLAAGLPVLAGALVYLGFALEHSKVVNGQDKLGAVQSQIAALRPSRALVNESTQVEGQRGPREVALQSVLAMQMPWDVTLGQVARVMPEGSWLTSVSALSPTPATVSTSTASAASSPTNVTLEGYAPTNDAIAHLLERLALVPTLGNIALVSTESTPLGKKTVIQFDITASAQHAANPLGGVTS
jgi:Tfp pilus assembly protein PilN